MEPLARWASEVGEGAGLSLAAGRRDRAWERQTEGVGSPGHFLGFRCRKCSTCLSVTPTPGLVRETVGLGGPLHLEQPGGGTGGQRCWTAGPGAMALKPEKRVASSVFITLAPPRRDEAVTEEVRRVSGEAWHGRPREPSVPLKAPGRPWSLPGRAAPPRLSNGDICAFCHKTVSPRELAVEAMKKQYHAQCFTCRTCRRQLAGQSFYQKDGRPLCEPCYQDTLEKCGRCGAVVWDNIIRALGQAFHPACFTCVSCARRIGAESFALDGQDQVYCLDDFYRKFAPVCSVCEKPIVPRDGKDAFKIECMGRNFHENCYRCEDCSVLLSVEPTEQGCYPLDDRLFCKPCHVRRSAAGCC
ncbi:filamin-binding LIM protein 1 [Fukomys damarensis]|uniref:filamin-binding LIM protein 1 n=1 Tax=Fukomys damarensis TaxID=885580 RepID=UPI00053F8328|nr:filamin-binding LIM protein 1 [Fukomys damarensis]